MTGGSIIALVAAWGLVGGKPVPQGVNWLIVGVTLILAAFLSWRVEWIKAGQWFVDLNFKNMARACDGLTGLQMEQVLHHYVGKRVKISGRLRDITRPAYGNPFLRFVHIQSDAEEFTNLRVWSWNWSFKGVDAFPKDSVLTVSGQICWLGCLHHDITMNLSGCELIRADFPEVVSTPAIPPTPTPGS